MTKMTKKKLIASMLAVAMTIVLSVPAFAGVTGTAELDQDTETKEQTVTVTSTIGSSYMVSVPASIQLTKTNESPTDYVYGSTYTVGVKGNIANNKKVVAGPKDETSGDVVTSTTFDLGSTDGTPTTASVGQTKTEWCNSPTESQSGMSATAYTNTEGTISTTLSTAGAYSGSFVIAYSLETITP